MRNVGPEEDSSAFHNREHTAVFGVAVTYWSLEYKTVGRVYVPILTDVMDKTSEAATHLMDFALRELKKLGWFHAIFSMFTTVKTFVDAGNHFKSEVWLHWCLFDFVKREHKRHIVQFFIGGHGKTGEVDGAVFGNAGVGGAYDEFIKKQLLRRTDQFL